MMRANELSDALALNIESVAVALLGNPTQRAGHEWRWGNKGSLAVVVKGAKRGRFFDHERGEGGDSLELVRHGIGGGSLIDAMRWGSDWLGDSSTPAPVRQAKPAAPAVDDDSERKRIEGALRIWSECIDLNGTLAAAYLASRGISGPIDCADLRFHPQCPAGGGERRPAMVALLRDILLTDEPCGIHRTFLLPDGTGKDPLGKKMLGRAKDAVIKLTPDAEVTDGLGIAEGIENALTLRAYGWRPVWAAGSAGAVRAFPLLGGIDTLTIFADADDRGAGAEAARECAARWREAGCRVDIHFPPAGSDWNDIAREIAA
jgi:hypothetical protein